MPVGPSHGGRSGGGGHGGGFGGSHGGGGPRGGGPHHGPHPSSSGSFVNGMIGGMIGASIANRRRERFESRYGVRPTDAEYNAMPRRTKPTGFLILAIFVAFFTFCTCIMLAGANSNIKSYSSTISIMETDWKNDYKPMLDAVDPVDFVDGTNGYYKTTATFRDLKYVSYGSNPTTPAYYKDLTRNNVDYHFIVYTYTDHNGTKRTGTTYTQFSANQVQVMGGSIEIAYYDKNGEHYSINCNYDLEKCEEYLYYKDCLASNKSTKSGVITALVIEILILGLFVTLYVLRVKKYYKLVAQDEEILFQKKQAEMKKATAEANAAASNYNRFCRYCGSKLEANATKCPSCGANLTK